MAEYYAVLSKAVASLEANAPETRREVYDKARNALIGQLKVIDPPLPTSEISRQRLELEEAIRRVEREAANAPAAPAPRARPPAAQPSGASVPARQTPQDVFRKAMEDSERPPVHDDPVPARADASWEDEDVRELRAERVPPARPTRSYLPSQGYVEEEPSGEEPRLVPNYDYEWDPAANARGAERDEARPDRRQAKAARGRRAEKAPREAAAGYSQREPRSSRLPAIILTILIVAMAGGLAALGYSQRAMIADLLSQFDSGNSTATAPAVAPVETIAAAPASGKDNDRLVGAGGSSVRDVTSNSAPAAPADSGAAAPAAPAATSTAAAASTDDGSADALVAQRAVLYEEPQSGGGADSNVISFNATVLWSFLSKPGEEPEIDGQLSVPDRGLEVKVHIRRNTDTTIPASHIVEVVVQPGEKFAGKAIRDIPRVVLKPSEEARGQPLVGASAKVADGVFWVALSGVAADVKSNLQLLKDGTWIDLPLVYDNGQRAILTFEKGPPGERVFAKAMDVWNG